MRNRVTPPLTMLAALYVAVAWLALKGFPADNGAVAWWPASGLLLASMLLWPERRRAVLGVFFAAHFVGGFAGETPFVPHLIYSLLVVAEAWLSTLIIERWSATPFRGDSLQDALRLFTATVVGPAIIGGVAAVWSVLRFGDSFFGAWAGWWFPDGTGMLLVTPLVTLLVRRPSGRPSQRWMLESAAIAVATFAAAAYIVRFGSPKIPITVVVVPVLVWGALRRGVTGLTAVALVFWTAATIATVRGGGSFHGLSDDPIIQLAWAHTYISLTVGSVLLFATVTEERRALADRLHATVHELRAASVRAGAVIASAPDMLAAADTDLRLFAFNESWAVEFTRLTKVRPSAGLEMRPLLERVAEDAKRDDGTRQTARVALAAWEGAAAGQRISVRRGPQLLGADREFLIEMNPIRDASGQPVGVVQQIRDVTDERRREQAEAQARRFESVGQLAGGIAHDFNNIITAILAYSTLLEHSMGADDERRADVEEIGRAATRAAELTGQLLAYARRQVVEPRTVELNALIGETERLLRRVLGERVRLVAHLATGLWPVVLDPAQFEAILVNLAINARDAMPNGGTLEISTVNVVVADGELPRGTHGARAAGDYVCVAVRDSGQGIHPDVLDRIFEPFFTTKEIGKGTGLGLASVFGSVQQAGGAIAVDSAVGHGTTFRIYLPRERQLTAPGRGATGSSSRGVSTANELVLVVEDEPAVLQATRRALERSGYRVLTADTARSAVRVLESPDGTEIRAVVADHGLPDDTGSSLLRGILERRPDLRAVLTSGYADGIESIDGVRFVAKPFAPASISDAVREVLDA